MRAMISDLRTKAPESYTKKEWAVIVASVATIFIGAYFLVKKLN